MLQVARLAPQQLGESSSLVSTFFSSRLNSDGGFQNRAGDTDLYYTVFGIEGLVALQAPVPLDTIRAYLRTFGDGDGLDFVHLSCLARAWAGLSVDPAELPARAILARLEAYRSEDGGYAQSMGAPVGNVYASYLAFGAYQDLNVALPDADRLVDAVRRLRARDGGFANRAGDQQGITTVTAAAVMLMRQLEAPIDPHLGMWLLDRCHASGGFVAAPSTPVPDLLSTATALHALTALGVPLAGIGETCLDFVDSLWTNRGGFFGHWADDDVDCEYTYYALLSLGHLSLVTPR